MPLSKASRAPLRATLGYAAFAGAWAVIAETLMPAVVRSPVVLRHLETIKEVAFVTVSALLIYKLLRHLEKQQQAALQSLRESEERFRATFEQAAVGIAHVATDGHWLRVNQALCDITGYSREELLAMRFQDITYDNDLDADLSMVQRLLAGDSTSYNLEKRYRRKDGKLVWIALTVTLVRHADGRPDYFISVIEEIDARKRMEEALQASEKRYHQMFAESPVPMWVFDTETRAFIDVNESATREYGYSREEFLAMSMDDIRPPEDIPRLMEKLRQLHTPHNLGVWKRRCKDGSVITVEVSAHTVDYNGLLATVVLGNNITARVVAEQERQEAMQRLRILSAQLLEVQEQERKRVARELHDEIGQSLTAVKIIVQTAGRKPECLVPCAALQEAVAITDHAIEQVRNLSRRLRPSQLDDLGLVAALRGHADRLARHAELAVHFAADELPKRLDPTVETACFRIAQEALTNILRHAEAREAWLTLARAGDALILTVRDNGKGFNKLAADNAAARGESLGLLSMRERAELAGGHLVMESSPGAGSLLRVSFPLPPANPEPTS